MSLKDEIAALYAPESYDGLALFGFNECKKVVLAIVERHEAAPISHIGEMPEEPYFPWRDRTEAAIDAAQQSPQEVMAQGLLAVVEAIHENTAALVDLPAYLREKS